MSDIDFYDDIHKFLDSTENSKSVNAKGFDRLIFKIMANTGVSCEVATIILKAFFQEIRNAMLRGDVVYLKDFGRFYISSPKSGKSKRTFPKFKLNNVLQNKLNDK